MNAGKNIFSNKFCFKTKHNLSTFNDKKLLKVEKYTKNILSILKNIPLTMNEIS